jgi:rubrerythrin
VIKVYEVAKDFEDRAANFYKQQLEKSKDPRASKLFQFLLDQERDHFRILDNSYRYVANPELWHAEEEGWIFDGG